MKYRVTNKIIVNTTLDSSEAIMFSKGGQHKIELWLSDIIPEQIQPPNEDEEEFARDPKDKKIEITIQLEASHHERYTWIVGEAKKT